MSGAGFECKPQSISLRANDK